jgi:hypothetical protein
MARCERRSVADSAAPPVAFEAWLKLGGTPSVGALARICLGSAGADGEDAGVQWSGRRGPLLAVLAVVALGSSAVAAPQIVAGVEIDYSVPLQREPDTEQRVLEEAKWRTGPPVRAVEVYRAPLAWDIGDGQGHVFISRIEFAAARDIDDAVREMATPVTAYAGQVFKQGVAKLSVSGLEARRMTFERELAGMRLGGELLVVGASGGNTIWQIQILFARRPLSASLDQDRQRALEVLASVRVAEPPRAKDRAGDLAAKGPDSPAAGCTLWDSEEKTRQVITGIGDAKARDPGKADRIDRRFTDVFDRYLEPSLDPDPARAERRRHDFCRTLDELLAELGQ